MNGFAVGDIVSRIGDDRHRVIEVGDFGDITVECLRPSSQVDCYEVGDVELNLAGRYQFVAPRPIVHFVGFRDDRYWNAVRIWGEPAFIHYLWDRRARRDIAPGDVVVFANGTADQPIGRFNGPDLLEKDADRGG